MIGLGVWLPPRPLEGGTPTRRVGGVEAVKAASDSMMDSTSSIEIRTFSGLRSLFRCYFFLKRIKKKKGRRNGV